MLKTRITAPYTIECFEAPITDPGPGEVLVRLLRAGICASDLQVYHGLHQYVSFPLIQGHEAAGIVEALGDGVTRVQVGDLVTLQPQFACGQCFACGQKRENVCEELKHLGISREGVFCEYATLPEWNTIPLPKEMDPTHAAMVEPVSVAVNALRKGDVQKGHRVVILGGGTIGNFIAQLCCYMGAEVFLTDVRQQKLALARSHGVQHCINTTEQDLQEEIKRVWGNKGVHVIYECAALAATFEQALTCANKASSIVIVGNFKNPIELIIPRLQRREIALLSVMGCSRANFLEAAELVSKGAVDFSGIVSARFPLRELTQAYEYIDQNPDTFKVMLHIAD